MVHAELFAVGFVCVCCVRKRPYPPQEYYLRTICEMQFSSFFCLLRNFYSNKFINKIQTANEWVINNPSHDTIHDGDDYNGLTGRPQPHDE